MSARSAAIVVDLGFGDAGKGLVVDALTRALRPSVVVRFHGGAQAGHNVVTPEGRHHTFSQLSAGTFVPGVRTYWGPDFIAHPTALLAEAEALAAVSVPDALGRIAAHRRALVTTPFHQAAGRLREMLRGEGRHGSCGVGVGETAHGALDDPERAVRVADLIDENTLRSKAKFAQERLRAALGADAQALRGWAAAEDELWILEARDVASAWADAASRAGRRIAIVDDGWLGSEARGAIVLEGAQGVLLDEWAGLHPHTTWSTCTYERAELLLANEGFSAEIVRVGVTRTYAIRHGEGPLPTEDRALDALLPERHNRAGGWQGSVRRGSADGLLLRYAVEVCGGIDTLALTHVDAIARAPSWSVSSAYTARAVSNEAREAPDPALFATEGGDRIVAVRPPIGRDLERQRALGLALRNVRPCLDQMRSISEVLAWFEGQTKAKVGLVSRGPSASDVTLCNFWAGRATLPT